MDNNGLKICDDKFYNYHPEDGFILSDTGYKGRSINLLLLEQYDEQYLSEQKKLMRGVLANIIDYRLSTRKVYSDMLGYIK